MAKQNFLERNEKLLITASGFAILYFGFGKPILNWLGITTSKKGRENKQKVEQINTAPDNENPFSPLYWQQWSKNPKNAGKPGTYLKTDAAQYWATIIHKAMPNGWTGWGDDEAVIYGVFRQLKNWLQVSKMADEFEKKYKTDLWEYLKQGDNPYNPASGLNNEELAIVHDIVYNKPKY